MPVLVSLCSESVPRSDDDRGVEGTHLARKILECKRDYFVIIRSTNHADSYCMYFSGISNCIFTLFQTVRRSLHRLLWNKLYLVFLHIKTRTENLRIGRYNFSVYCTRTTPLSINDRLCRIYLGHHLALRAYWVTSAEFVIYNPTSKRIGEIILVSSVFHNNAVTVMREIIFGLILLFWLVISQRVSQAEGRHPVRADNKYRAIVPVPYSRRRTQMHFLAILPNERTASFFFVR